MAFPLVSLIAGTVLAATSSWALVGFPPLGMFPGMPMNPLMAGGMFGNQFGAQQGLGQDTPNPNLLTCIGADTQDPQAQIRLTLKPLLSTPTNSPNPFFPGPMGAFGFGPTGFPGQGGQMIDRDQGMQWEVSGILINSQVLQKAGSYELGVFQGGRTFGTCQSSALGQVLPPRSALNGLNGFGPLNPLMGLGAFGGMGPFGAMNPLLGGANPLLGGGAQQGAGGVAARAIITQGPTIYTAIVSDLSYNQLVGSSIALCDAIQGGQCVGRIPFCCSVVKDQLPADRVYVDANAAATAGVGGLAGMAGIGGAAFPTGGIIDMGAGDFAAGVGGLGGAGLVGGNTLMGGDNAVLL